MGEEWEGGMVLEACQGEVGKGVHRQGRGGRAGLAWVQSAFQVTRDQAQRPVASD